MKWVIFIFYRSKYLGPSSLSLSLKKNQCINSTSYFIIMIITICIINFILTTVFLLLSLYHHDLDYLYHNYHQYGTIIYFYYHLCHYQFPIIIIINAMISQALSLTFSVWITITIKSMSSLPLYLLSSLTRPPLLSSIASCSKVLSLSSLSFSFFQLPDGLFLVWFLINLFILPSIYYLSKLPPAQPPIKTPVTITL